MTPEESEEMFRKQSEEAVVAHEQPVQSIETTETKPKATKRTTRSRIKKTANTTKEVKGE